MKIDKVKNEEIIKRAIYELGIDLNLNQATEELAELIVAINHYRRGRVPYIKVVEEMADVSVILDLLKIIIAKDSKTISDIVDLSIKEMANQKINRLKQRLDEKE